MSRSSVGIVAVLVVISVLAPAAIGGATAQEEDTVTVTVAVVDSSGDPVGDIDVTVTWGDGDGGQRNVTTAGNGKAFVDVPNGSDIRIQIDDDRYVRNNPYTAFNVGEEEVTVPVSLSGQATIVVEDSNGRPVGDANVGIFRSGADVQRLTTGENGEVRTDRIERDTYDMRVTKSGYFTNDTATLSLSEASTTKTVVLRAGTVPVTFNVVDDNFEEARPVEDATVRVSAVGYSQQTFENGQASTSLPVNRVYSVEVTKDGYTSATRQFTVSEEERSVDVSIRRTPELNVEVANNRVVVGESTFVTVTDEYGDPVSSASISVDGQPAGATNSNGQATVQIPTEGNVTITVSDEGLSESVIVEGVSGDSEETETTTEPTTETTAEPTTEMTTEEPTETETEEPTETETDGGSGENGPGFGLVAALVAIVAALALARRR